MINNRQNGRRRGRGGGPRSPNPSSPGNRQDNRSRGNASQLHEKYKALARDAQLAGDRVQTEYYLQFADHYFRVLSEGRARFEEQRRQRDDFFSSDEDEDQDEAQAAGEEGEEGDEGERDMRETREARPERAERFERNERRPRRPRVRAEREGEEEGGEERISLDSLPPAISPAENDGEERAPRRRVRRPRAAEGEAEAAPAV